MKKVALLFILFISLKTFAQTYPFAEGFDGMPGNQPPVGWGGSMKVLLNHGINDLKGLSARVSSGVTVDTSISPLIGPLTATSALSFRYRIIDQANYPSTPTNLVGGDMVEVLLSSDSVNYQTILQIDENNHNPTFNFNTKKIYLQQYAGQNVQFKFRCTYGTGASFFVDIDTVRVFNDPQSGIDELSGAGSAFKIYPNPLNQASTTDLQLQVSSNLIGTDYRLTNILGATLLKGKVNEGVNQLPVGNLPSGIYFIQVATLTRKLIIK